jgi:hypothetical protein
LVVELPVKALPIALLLLALGSGAALAQSADAPPSSQSAPAQAADGGEEIVVEGEVPKERRKICTTRTETGSIVPKRVCRTVAQIEADELAARESVDRMNRDRETRDAIQAMREPGV